MSPNRGMAAYITCYYPFNFRRFLYGLRFSPLKHLLYYKTAPLTTPCTMRKLLLFYCLAAFLLVTGAGKAYAQDQPAGEPATITGTVKDSKDGGPLPGVNVVIKGTTTGTITDFDGKYTLKVPGGSVLVFSYIGYNSQEFSKLRPELNVTLEQAAKSTEEVVVVGYGSQRSKEQTGVVSSIHAEDLRDRPMPTFDAALQGRAPGLQIASSSGIAGSAVRVRIRGQASVNGSSDPLYVIDGIILDTRDQSATDGGLQALNQNPLSTIPPGDIERIDVLKDASATGVYGARGANGVIVITTKRGKAGKTRFNLSYYTGTTEATHKLQLLDGPQYLSLYKEARKNDSPTFTLADKATIGGAPYLLNTKNLPNTNWVDQMLRVGRIQNVDLSASGGNEKTTFYVGLGFQDNTGMLIGTDYNRVNGRINIDNRPNDYLKIGASVGLTYVENKLIPTSYGGGFGTAQSSALPIYPIYDSTTGKYAGANLKEHNTSYNPIAQTADDYYTKSFRNLTTMYAEAQITPALQFHAEGSMDLNQVDEDYYYSGINRYYTVGSNTMSLPAIKERHVSSRNLITNDYLTFTKQYGEHSVNAVAGASFQYYNRRDNGLYPAYDAVGFTDPYYTRLSGNMHFASFAPANINTGATVSGWNALDYYSFASYFARFNYGYKGRYLAQLNVRADGSSKFGPDKRFGVFPSGSVGWVISEEEFMKNNAKWITFLKLKSGFGLTGNANINSFLWNEAYQQGSVYANQTGQTPTTLANPKLSWEKATQFDGGLEFGLFNGSISGTLGYFLKNSSNLLVATPVQSSALGQITVVTTNSPVVEIRNQGVEATISTKNVDRAFKWTTDFNITFLQNKVLTLGGLAPDNFSGGYGDSRMVEGQPMSVSYVAEFAGINPATGQVMIKDLNGHLVVANNSNTYDNRKPFGSPFPKYYGGIDNRFEFMGFDLSVFFTYSVGQTIYDDGAKFQMGGMGNGTLWNQRTEALDRWQKPGDMTVIPKLTLNSGNVAFNTSAYVFNADFLRLRTLQVGYTLPTSLTEKIKVANLRLYIMANNLALWTPYKGWDPEVVRYAETRSNVGSNISFNAPYLPTPQARSFQAGINLTF